MLRIQFPLRRMALFFHQFGLMFLLVNAYAFAEDGCDTIKFFYDQNENSEIQLDIKKEKVKEFVRDINGMKPAKSDQVFFLKLILPKLADTNFLDALDEVWIIPNLNTEILDPICEEFLGEPHKLVCGAYLSPKATLSLLFRKNSTYDVSEYINLSKDVVAQMKADVICD